MTIHIIRSCREFKVVPYRGTTTVYYQGRHHTVADDTTYTAVSELYIHTSKWLESMDGDLDKHYAPICKTMKKREWKPIVTKELQETDPELAATLDDLRITAIEHYEAELAVKK